jgi:hypothetical protein
LMLNILYQCVNIICQECLKMLSKEELESEYQRVAFWINNLDTKISFALGATGVLLGFIFSNEKLGKTLKKHLDQLLLWNEKSIESGILLGLFVITSILLLAAMWLFLTALKARINPEKYKEPGMVSPSNIFFGDISKGNFYTYKCRLENSQPNEWERDMQTQIYINSCICSKKAALYNWGITALRYALITFAAYYVWLIYININE